MKKPTAKQIQKLQALRTEAECHGDDKTVASVDAALAGDVAALAACGIVTKAAAKAAKDPANRAPVERRSPWAPRFESDSDIDHPWGHDA